MKHRVDALGYAGTVALGMFQQRPNVGGGIAAGGSALMLAVGANNLLFLKVATMLIALDLLTGLGRSVQDPDDVPDVGKMFGGILGKLMRFTLIVVASGIDWTMIGLAPASVRPDMVEAMIVTKGALVLLIMAEGASIVSNVTKFDPGIGGLGRYLEGVLDGLRPRHPKKRTTPEPEDDDDV